MAAPVRFCLSFLVWAVVPSSAQAEAGASEPEPGSHAYFEQKIRGLYAYDDGELLPVRTAMRPVALGVPFPLSASPLAPGRRPQRLVVPITGCAVQTLSSNLVAVGQAATNISGLVTFPPICLVALLGNVSPAEGESLHLLAVPGGANPYREGAAARLRLYRQVAEPTYEDYRNVFERDSQVEDDPIVSFVREEQSQEMQLTRLAREAALEAAKKKGNP